MVREPQLSNSAPWKQRFRAPVIASTEIVRLAPTRGLVMSNRSGIYQPYTWDVSSGELRHQLADHLCREGRGSRSHHAGRNDTRTPPRSIEMYEAKMKSLGKDIEVHWFDAGHGSLSVEQNIEFQELVLRFAYRILNSKGS
jgi:hypothetical protein